MHYPSPGNRACARGLFMPLHFREPGAKWWYLLLSAWWYISTIFFWINLRRSMFEVGEKLVFCVRTGRRMYRRKWRVWDRELCVAECTLN